MCVCVGLYIVRRHTTRAYYVIKSLSLVNTSNPPTIQMQQVVLLVEVEYYICYLKERTKFICKAYEGRHTLQSDCLKIYNIVARQSGAYGMHSYTYMLYYWLKVSFYSNNCTVYYESATCFENGGMCITLIRLKFTDNRAGNLTPLQMQVSWYKVL